MTATKEDEYRKLVKDSDEEDDLYSKSIEYRLWFGPSIERYGDFGYPESLVGIIIEFTFQVAGRCTGRVESGVDDIFEVIWSCGGDDDDDDDNRDKLVKRGTFSSKLGQYDVLLWHFWTQKKQLPDWLEEHGNLDEEILELFQASKLVDFHRPVTNDRTPVFDICEDEDDNDDWWVSLSRFNDPNVPPESYGGNHLSYPLALLLVIICIYRVDDPSIKLPTIFLPGDERVYSQADTFCRSLTGKGGKRGGELESVYELSKSVLAKANSITDQNWRNAYEYVLAFILCMSDDFEGGAVDSWTMFGEKRDVLNICNLIFQAIGTIILHKSANISKRDKGLIEKHLPKTNFSTFIRNFEDEFNKDDYPDGRRSWDQLQMEFDLSKI